MKVKVIAQFITTMCYVFSPLNLGECSVFLKISMPKGAESHQEIFLGSHSRMDHPTLIDQFLAGITLFSVKEMQELFPDTTILRVRFLLVTKSMVAYRTDNA